MDASTLLLEVRALLAVFTLYYYYDCFLVARSIQRRPYAFLYFMGWAAVQLITRILLLAGVNSPLISVLITAAAALQVLGARYLMRIMRADLP